MIRYGNESNRVNGLFMKNPNVKNPLIRWQLEIYNNTGLQK